MHIEMPKLHACLPQSPGVSVEAYPQQSLRRHTLLWREHNGIFHKFVKAEVPSFQASYRFARLRLCMRSVARVSSI